MILLCEETFVSSDGQQTSRNLWYGSADMTVQGEYGKHIKLNTDLRNDICTAIKNDLSTIVDKSPTETNWYFYDSEMTQALIGSNILPVIMVREKAGAFISNFSISDHDFAVNIDEILMFKSDFDHFLANHSCGCS